MSSDPAEQLQTQAMDEDPQSSDNDDDSDDSDFEEVEVGVEDVALITKLEGELEANPNLYDVHLQVIYVKLFRIRSEFAALGPAQQPHEGLLLCQRLMES
jgi:hypothetical protein